MLISQAAWGRSSAVADSIGALAESADVVISMVSDDHALEAVSFGPDGAFALGDIEAIEVYNHPSILPDQFNSGRDSLCGVVVVWRKQSSKQ